MTNRVTILGVHPVDLPRATVSVHLIDIVAEGDRGEFVCMDIAQEDLDRPQRDWQMAWAEHLFVEETGQWESIWPTRDAYATADRARFAFYFHNLELTRPLRSSFGP